ncbi:uncharacterized protein PITG_04554 [Phytophthora infestans T30-4]|uniref:Acetyl-CoA carboxylase central domain-containing protein n=1 Tax=Phytophthora infestans (strain T30-4) TaxID=403677 RepID=D0N1I0_PHYIT|nr:uncharacterized protein PITG_04554 [Phytophthora infestans T30-4]EEY68159.1 conserved hypothetical protein [Phytophthora infestans T30-4]|eukprot:XP_002905318.1 conserved hypothetical protein [Phytophthora infestans T30-4]
MEMIVAKAFQFKSPVLDALANISPDFERHGAIVRFTNLEAFKNVFTDVMTLFPLVNKTLSVRKDPLLLSHNIRLVTSVRPQNIENISSHNADMALYPNIYTFPGRLNYNEDKVVRQMEAPISYKLMPCRLQNYSVTPLASEVMNVQFAFSCVRWCVSLTTMTVARARSTMRTRALCAHLWMR